MEVIMPEDNLAQFKKILANLPEDRRKRLYDRLHAMPASQREAFINDFTRKYLSGQRKHPSKKTGTQVKANVSGKKPSSPNGSSQKKSKPKHSLQMVRRSLSPQLFRLRSLSLLTVRRSLLQAASLRISIPPLPSGTRLLTSMALK